MSKVWRPQAALLTESHVVFDMPDLVGLWQGIIPSGILDCFAVDCNVVVAGNALPCTCGVRA